METNETLGPLPDPEEEITIQDLPPSELHPWLVFSPDAAHQPYIDAAREAREYLEHGQVAEGYQALADAGDHYAGAATQVTGDLPGLFSSMVQANWNVSAGPQAYAQHFQEVAETHLGNYLDHIEQHGGMLPSSSDIEESYVQSVTQHGLPSETAIDPVINDAPLGNAWEHVVGLEAGRISDHDVGAGLGRVEALDHLGVVGVTGTSYWVGDHLLEARNDLQAYGDHVQHTAQEFYDQAGDHLLAARNDLQAFGDQAQHTAQEVYEQAGDRLLDGRNALQDLGDHAQHSAQELYNHAGDHVFAIHDQIQQWSDDARVWHEDRNIHNECPKEEPMLIGPMNLDNDPQLEQGAIDGRGERWELRDPLLSGFHNGDVYNQNDGRGEKECEFNEQGHFQTGGTYDYVTFHNPLEHTVVDVLPHLLDPHYTQPDLTTVVDVGQYQPDVESSYTPPLSAPLSFDSSHDQVSFPGADWSHPAMSEIPSHDLGGSFDLTPHGPDISFPHGAAVDEVSHPDSFPSMPSSDFQIPDFAGQSEGVSPAFDYGSHPDVTSQFHQGVDFHAEPSGSAPSIHFDTDHSSLPSVDSSHTESGVSYGDAFPDGGSYDSSSFDGGSFDSGSSDDAGGVD